MKNLFVGKVCLVRSSNAGVFYGEVVKHNKNEVVLRNVRRIWKWDGAAATDEIALRGIGKPKSSKVCVLLEDKYVTNVIEITPLTQEALDNLNAINSWSENE